jgi:hypothetical protein
LAGVDKRISWSCARLSFSILLQDARVDAATVALLIGHTSTRYVNEIYKRYRPQNQLSAILTLPDPGRAAYFYDVHPKCMPANAGVGLYPINAGKPDIKKSMNDASRKRGKVIAKIAGI